MPDPDYYPLEEGRVLAYASEDADGVLTIKDETIAVTEQGGKTVATVRKTVAAPGQPPEVKERKVTRDETGVYCYGEKELPLPAARGAAWDIPPRRYEIASLTQTVTVPAGTFRDCLRVTYLIAGGDGGSGELDYAPGVGLIRHWCNDEGEPFEILLTGH